MNKRDRLKIAVMSWKPYGNTETITNVFGMLHAKFYSFEIRVFVMPNLIAIDQREMPIAENKLYIGWQKLMGID